MNDEHGQTPPEHVLSAFGADGAVEPMAGGSGLAWRAGNLVVKPADTDEESLAWQANALGSLSFDHVRLALPQRSTDGRFVVDGWMASSFCGGSHQRGRWLDIIAVGERLHAALAGVGRPSFVDRSGDHWSTADRAAWGDVPVAPYVAAPHIARLAALLAPVDAPPQVIHGDLTGNVLFADPGPPAVIDLAVYWRPAGFATAIVVVDALAWEGATPEDIARATAGEEFGQFLARALLFRIIADWLADRNSASACAAAYASGVDLAIRLIAG